METKVNVLQKIEGKHERSFEVGVGGSDTPFLITTEHCKFGRQITSDITPDQARQLAAALRSAADKAEEQKKYAEAVLMKRRDVLADKFAPRATTGSNWYANVSDGLRNAIDHIIAMEDAKS
jgi:hypothetical protein